MNALNKVKLNHLTFSGGNAGNGNLDYAFQNASDTFVLDGNLVLQGGTGRTARPHSGNIAVKGHVTINTGTVGGSTAIKLTGGNDQTVTRTGGTSPQGHWTIDKPGGTVSMGSNVSLTGTGQQLVWTRGALNLSINTLTVAGAVTIGENATTLGVTVADAQAGHLTCNNTVSGIGNVGLEVSVTAEPEETEGLTYTILSNNTAFGVGVEFASETWLDGWKGDVLYTANDGKNVTLANLRYGAPGTLFMVH